VSEALARWLTPPGSAALALLQLESHDLAGVIGQPAPEPGRLSLRTIADVDACVLLRTGDRTLLLTPHGGPRIRQRLTDWLRSRGVRFDDAASPWRAATSDPVMRRALETLPRAASDDAVPLLLAQAERWRRSGAPGAADAERSRRLQRLVDAPLVALVGPPNAGKSSLMNALAGRTAAVASAEAGTTRDHVTVSVSMAGLTCTLLDAPGLRETADPLEAEAIALARARMDQADLIVAVAAPGQAFPALPGAPLRVRSMSDLPGPDPEGTEHRLSAHTGAGLAELARLIRERLVPAADLASERPFDFH
jgi:tRNA modification GTPase